MNYFLDSSALVAHALHQPGAVLVQGLIENEENTLFFSVLSLFELAGVLRHQGAGTDPAIYWETYRQCAAVVPVTADLAQAAWKLRETTGRRIPLADTIIAATALSCGATLVHRDRHLATIPESFLPQLRLPSS